MAKYKGIVREIYEYEIEIEAEDGGEAINMLKEKYNNSEDGKFVADANSYLRAEYSLRK